MKHLSGDAVKPSMSSSTTHSPPRFLDRRNAIVVFLAFAAAYFCSALVRSITATLAPVLTQEFSLQARDLGLLGGGYFFGFAVMQLPLGRQWKLPTMLEECIAFHHDIESAKRYPRETALVHIANILAQMAEVQTLDTDDVAPINPLAWEVTGLSATGVIEATVRETQAEIAEAEILFFGKAFPR